MLRADAILVSENQIAAMILRKNPFVLMYLYNLKCEPSRLWCLPYLVVYEHFFFLLLI